MEEIKKIVEPVPETIETIFENIYKIPVFQRPYKWGKDQIEEFIEDLENAFNQDKYWFAGTLYIKQKHKINSSLYEYDIIDGQQRITTVTIILMSIQTILLKNEACIEGKTIQDIQKKLYKAEKYLIENEGIEKEIINYTFENACREPQNLDEKINVYHNKNKIEENFKNNFKLIYEKIEKHTPEELINLYKFMKEKMIFITNTVNLPYNEMFEIFDAINSKGKALDEIDKIKSYIFRNLPETDYEIYLKKWGELIEKTEDNLEEYVYIFMKAYIKYYKSTGMKYFKAFCNNELKAYYQKDELSDALKAFINDLYKYVEIYMNMRKSELPYKSNQAQFYIKAINHLKYIHPLPLIFRALCENKYNFVPKEDTNKLIREAFCFMFNFQTMNERDSKETQEFFSKLMSQLHKKEMSIDDIVNEFKKALKDRGITKATMKNRLAERISIIDKNKRETYILIMFYEFSNDKGKIDYDKTTWMLEHKEAAQVDHILPLHPEKDNKYKYEVIKQEDKERLKLNKGHDFGSIPDVYDGMEYEEFTNRVLDKIGNLQICWRNDNLAKSNRFIKLTDYSNYTKYAQIKQRANNMSEQLIKTELFQL